MSHRKEGFVNIVKPANQNRRCKKSFISLNSTASHSNISPRFHLSTKYGENQIIRKKDFLHSSRLNRLKLNGMLFHIITLIRELAGGLANTLASHKFSKIVQIASTPSCQ